MDAAFTTGLPEKKASAAADADILTGGSGPGADRAVAVVAGPAAPSEHVWRNLGAGRAVPGSRAGDGFRASADLQGNRSGLLQPRLP